MKQLNGCDGAFISIGLFLWCVAAWVTHIVVCFKTA